MKSSALDMAMPSMPSMPSMPVESKSQKIANQITDECYALKDAVNSVSKPLTFADEIPMRLCHIRELCDMLEQTVDMKATMKKGC